MKLTKYLKDKISIILLNLFAYIIILLILLAFKCDISVIISISSIIIVVIILSLYLDFFSKKNFYNNLIKNIESLDKKYLVLETLEKPNFYEGKIFYQALYETNKSMIENVKKYELSVADFKEYIEMWIHEVKIPIASLILITHNNKNAINKKLQLQIQRIENYVEQVLYYTRSENVEKDCLIKENDLAKIISSIALKNKDYLLENNIDFKVENIKIKVLTDSKWLEFIINQIINNSIKYKKNIGDSYIKISVSEQEKTITLNIYDNGIGIKKSDLPRVFDKSFTGYNGREKVKSTGMGLYIVKKLCLKLGHNIEIISKENEYTKVKIIFSKNEFYNVVK